MSTINDLPNPSDFGEAYDYSVWAPNTEVQLCNVAWTNDYRDIVKFTNKQAVVDYCNSNSVGTYGIGHMTYAKMGQPLRLPIPYGAALSANYVRVRNPAQPTPANFTDRNGNPVIVADVQRDYYYFILGVNYIAQHTTEFILQLDVWQTFGYDVQFGNCYIERGHIGIANTKQMDHGGRDYLTIPEGLDIGADYKVISYNWQIDDFNSYGGYRIMVVATTDLAADPGTVDAPNIKTAIGCVIHSVPSGCDYWIFTPSQFQDFMAAVSSVPWVAQGIIGIYVIPPVRATGIANVAVPGTHAFKVTDSGPDTLTGPPPADIGHVPNGNISYADATPDITSGHTWRDSIINALPARYQGLNKFLTSPYCVIEATTYSATPVVIKPECMPVDDHLHFFIGWSIMQPGARLVFVPAHYNGDATSNYPISNYDDWLDVSTVVANFPSTNIVNSGALEWLAANHANLAYAQQSANWAQQKALQGNTVAAQQASASMMNMANQNQIQLNQMNQSTDLAMQMSAANGIMGALGGAAGGELMGGPPGALAGLMGSAGKTALGMAQIGAQNDIAKTAVRSSFGSNYQTAEVMRDTNKQYGDFAARGDYANEIAGIQAQVQSAQMIQPSMVGQMGGDIFQFITQGFVLDVKPKLPQLAHIKAVGEFWLRYGYAIQQFAVPPTSLQVMSNFTYWKLRETYLVSSNVPESFKQIIRGIFEKGVTVWANPSDIGTIDLATNTPLPGVTLP